MAETILPIRGEDINWDEILKRTALKIGDRELPEACQQLEGEADHWYARFYRYMLLGNNRSVKVVYECFDRENIAAGTRRRKPSTKKEDLKPNVTTPEPWRDQSKQFKWKERAAVFDRFICEVDLELWTERRKEWREKEWNLACEAYEVVLRVLREKWAERQRWSFKDISDMMKSTSGLARSATESPAGLTIEGAIAYLIKYGYVITDGRVQDPLAEQISRLPDDLLIGDDFNVEGLAEEVPNG